MKSLRNIALRPLFLLNMAVFLVLAGCQNEKEKESSSIPSSHDTGLSLPEGWNATLPGLSPSIDSHVDNLIKRIFNNPNNSPSKNTTTWVYPLANSIFPPDFLPPTFLWNDSVSDSWVLSFHSKDSLLMYAFTQSPQVLEPEIDPRTISEHNVTPTSKKEKNWTFPSAVWEALKKRVIGGNVRLQIFGFQSAHPEKILGHQQIVFSVSKDSVKAPIFYRDVPILPNEDSARGVISPLPQTAMELIEWRLRDVSKSRSKIVLKEMSSCANCHSFSHDGKTMGLDIDGPQSDKGAYALKKIEERMKIESTDLINWNYDFKDPSRKKKTIGFLSRVSPDGQHVITTVNESMFVVNFRDYKYIQVFYPTRGQLAVYSKKTGRIHLLPGADDPKYVHCDPVWSPDGKNIVFARAIAKDPFVKGQKLPAYPNAPEETQIQYDLYRIPFNNGQGGTPLPISGASANNMSNTFPKVSKDGKWIVYVKCKNGQLLRPDGELWIVPFAGGTARRMNCNTDQMNSWHSFSPNSRWMVFSSKSQSFYTQMFLTHIDENGMDSPPIFIPNSTADNRAVNLPEFVNIPYEAMNSIEVPAINHMRYLQGARKFLEKNDLPRALEQLHKALEVEKKDIKFRAEVLGTLGWLAPDVNEGIRFLKRAIETDSTYPLAPFNLGIKLEEQGKEKEALQAYKKSLNADPDNVWAMASLTRIYMSSKFPELRNLKKAEQLAQKANELTFFQEPSLLKTLARVYSTLGRFEEAIELAKLGIERAQARNLREEAQSIIQDLEGYKAGNSYFTADR